MCNSGSMQGFSRKPQVERITIKSFSADISLVSSIAVLSNIFMYWGASDMAVEAKAPCGDCNNDNNNNNKVILIKVTTDFIIMTVFLKYFEVHTK
jgi:hypothetical protein